MVERKSIEPPTIKRTVMSRQPSYQKNEQLTIQDQAATTDLAVMRSKSIEASDVYRDMVTAEKSRRETRQSLKFMKQNHYKQEAATKVNLKQIKDFVKIQEEQSSRHESPDMEQISRNYEKPSPIPLSLEWDRKNQDLYRSRQMMHNMN